MVTAFQRTSLSRCAVLAMCFADWCSAQEVNQPAPKPAFVPKITISKETTWVTGPLKANGAIDYHAVVNQRYRQGVTVENNAVVLLYRAMGPVAGGTRLSEKFFRELGIKPPPEDGDYLDRERFQGGNHDADVFYSRPWTTEEFPDHAAWLESVAEPLKYVVEASERSEYFSPLVSDGADDPLIATLLPGVQETRTLARALVSRAMWRLGEERRFEAWADLMATHRLGRLMSRDSTYIGWLVGSAIEQLAIDAELRFLAETQSNAKLLKLYRRSLQKLPPRAALVDRIDVEERASALDACQRVARRTLPIGECLSIFGDDFNLLNQQPILRRLAEESLAGSADWDEVMKSVNQWHDRIVANGRLPTYRQRADAHQKLDQELKRLARQQRDPVAWLVLLGDKPALTQFTADLLIVPLITSVSNHHLAEASVAQRFQNLETAMALAAWFCDRGSYPKSLADLVPQYLAEAPKDLFTDQPLKYELTADGYRFYSFGVNEKDDDGCDAGAAGGGDDLAVRMLMHAPK